MVRVKIRVCYALITYLYWLFKPEMEPRSKTRGESQGKRRANDKKYIELLTILLREHIMQPVPSRFAQEHSHDGREVEVPDLLRAKSVHGLKEYRERRVDAHDPSKCLYSRRGRRKITVSIGCKNNCIQR